MDDKKLDELLYQIGDNTPKSSLDSEQIYNSVSKKRKVRPYVLWPSIGFAVSVLIIGILFIPFSINADNGDSIPEESRSHLFLINNHVKNLSDCANSFKFASTHYDVESASDVNLEKGYIYLEKPFVVSTTSNSIIIHLTPKQSGYYQIQKNKNIINVKPLDSAPCAIYQEVLSDEKYYCVSSLTEDGLVEIELDSEYLAKQMKNKVPSFDVSISYYVIDYCFYQLCEEVEYNK